MTSPDSSVSGSFRSAARIENYRSFVDEQWVRRNSNSVTSTFQRRGAIRPRTGLNLSSFLDSPQDDVYTSAGSNRGGLLRADISGSSPTGSRKAQNNATLKTQNPSSRS